ncbi:MAG: polyphosphate polymerase domain-containing protein [Ruminococcaceae bacterium]|nr:polyphosphate polymerase domain-containing protein [Oscillospiraceae bacterium]
MDYRHELKFIVTTADLALLRAKLSNIIKTDTNQDDEEGYIITSLYFDDVYNTCLKENINGYDKRDKYRLRLYNNSTELIKLERKSKVNGMTAKISADVNSGECAQFMDSHIPWLDKANSAVKNKLLCEMKLKGMMPKCIVQYEREAFVYRPGNVRITFDKNISGSLNTDTFMNSKILTVPLLGKDIHVLEVKYDNMLPAFIAELLETEKLQRTAFSKYAYARQTLG